MPTETALEDWKGAKAPDHRVLKGRFVRLEPLSVEQHGDQLWQEYFGPGSDPTTFDLTIAGPFEQRADFDAYLSKNVHASVLYAVIDLTSGIAQGIIAFVAIDSPNGAIEIAYVYFGTSMRQSVKSTEAVFLMLQEAFALGNRRVVWSCNNKNDRSKRAALRFGFTFEAVFRQLYVSKGKSRDDAWFSMLDREWPVRQRAFIRWLSPENFDDSGRQIQSLKQLQVACLNSIDE